MPGIYFLVPTFFAIIISMLIVRAGAIALVMTGMEYQKAKFQALSAFSGTGFTTKEAEKVINNPSRRRIISWLIVLGNVGIVTVIVTATSSFSHSEGIQIGENLLALIVGVFLIIYFFKYTPYMKHWENFIHKKMESYRVVDEDNSIEELLHLREGYSVVRCTVTLDSKYKGVRAEDIGGLFPELTVLGIEHHSHWDAVTQFNDVLQEGDNIILYGKISKINPIIKNK